MMEKFCSYVVTASKINPELNPRKTEDENRLIQSYYWIVVWIYALQQETRPSQEFSIRNLLPKI